jgi:hypothetical protein
MPSIFSTDYVRPACQKPDQRGTISGSRRSMSAFA